MRAPLRLARSICSARPSRLYLLSAAVALSVILVTSIACAMASLNAAIIGQIDTQIGTAEVRLRPTSGLTLDSSVVDRVKVWEGVDSFLPRLQSTLSLVIKLDTMQELIKDDPDSGFEATRVRYATNAFVNGVDPTIEFEHRKINLIEGRYPEKLDEITIDLRVAQRLSWRFVQKNKQAQNGLVEVNLLEDPAAYLGKPFPSGRETIANTNEAMTLNEGVGVRIGDALTVPRLFGKARVLTVVGIVEPAPLGGKPIAFTTIETLDALNKKKNQLTDIEIQLTEGVDPEVFVSTHEEELLPKVILQTTGRVTSGVENNLEATRLGIVLITVISLISAAFIITTGLTTGVSEQQRMLAVLRAVGARRRQLAMAQLFVGCIVAGLGAIFGVPLGIVLAWILAEIFDQQMAQGLVIPVVNILLVVIGAVGSGLIGAMWPAWRAASLSPLRAMTERATPHKVKGILIVGFVGALGVLSMASIVLFLSETNSFFWVYAGFGLPVMFIGYFLISVPVVILVAKIFSVPLSKLLGLPAPFLGRTVRATPYRHGFTAGALMTGLALMIGIWTNGSAAMRDWLGKIEFPDAFAYGLPLSLEAQGILDSLPYVEQSSAISMFPVRTDAFGVKGLSQYKTNFISFEPDSFFEMAKLDFVQGDEQTAKIKLEEGGCVIVAREFLVARGLGVGDTFECTDVKDELHQFEIVGVVTSPGLELVSQYFDLGDNFVNQAIGSVFGSRADMVKHFGMETAQLIQVDLNEKLVEKMGGDEIAVMEMRRELLGAGVLNVGSGRMIRKQIEAVFTSTLVVLSTVAIGAMLVACFGVANLIVAEVNARKYELGVLRAVGASRSQLVRLISGQAILIALTACILGAGLGMQAAWGGREMNRQVIGIDIAASLPMDAIGLAWGVAILLSLAAAAPSAMKLNRISIRSLLSGQ